MFRKFNLALAGGQITRFPSGSHGASDTLLSVFRVAVQAPPMYDLYSVADHMGGMGGGHYVATCLNPGDKQWYTYNDQNVSKAKSPPTKSSAAYILFYVRNDKPSSSQA